MFCRDHSISIFKNNFGIKVWLVGKGSERGCRGNCDGSPQDFKLKGRRVNPSLSNLAIRAGARNKAAARIPVQFVANVSRKKGVVKEKTTRLWGWAGGSPIGGGYGRVGDLPWKGAFINSIHSRRVKSLMRIP